MKKNTSFTLIELLVVIVIIGVIAGVIIVTTTSSIGKANITKLKVFEESVANNLAANMVSRWKLDEVNTAPNPDTTPDAWGNNTGSVYGATLQLENDCVSNKCLYFDGSFNDYVQVPAIPLLKTGTAFVLSAWVYPENTGTYRTIMGYDTRHRLLISAAGAMLSEQSGDFGFYSQEGAVPNQKWIHVIYWSNGQEERWYINGILSGVPHSFDSIEWDQAFKIGQYDLNFYPYKGKIDDVRVYNNAFSAQEIKKEYLTGLNSLLFKGLISKDEYNSRIEALSQN
ncbi:MAG: LamG domain-containing protein [Candidatus Pacebacteria bacterium]|nr:LamG domain-containing protein [Candidatus Paceibacterota bacterium]